MSGIVFDTGPRLHRGGLLTNEMTSATHDGISDPLSPSENDRNAFAPTEVLLGVPYATGAWPVGVNVDIETVLRKMRTIEPNECAGGVSDAAVDAASAALGLPFPRGYSDFLRHCGAGSVSFQEFIGLGGERHLDVVRVTQDLRVRKGRRFALGLIPVLNDGGGNYECIDTSQPTAENEFRVVRWLHDGGDQQVCEVLAESYLEWLWNTLQSIRREDVGGVA